MKITSPPGTATTHNPRNQMKRQLNKQYIATKVNNVIEPMTISYFQQGAKENMIDFMLKYIDDHYGKRPSHNEGERHELEYLRKAVPALRKELVGEGQLSPGTSTGESEKKQDLSSEDSYGEEDENVLSLPQPVPRKTGPRMSVSAEVFGTFNKQEEFKPIVHPKSEEQIEAIKGRIKGNFMFDALNPKDTKAIIDAIVPTKKQAGDTVIKEGEDGDNFYVVESGTLNCTKRLKPEDQEDTFLKEYKAGESFGELALLYNAPRAATIIAKEDVELWSLDRNTFTHILKTAMQKKREKYDTFLDQVEILKTLQKSERQKLADALKDSWHESGDVLIKEGDKNGDQFFMIMEGECIATKVLEPGKPAQNVKDYHAGDYFGERALLHDVPRGASIVAQSQVHVVTLDRAAFKRLLGPIESILERNESEYNKYLK